MNTQLCLGLYNTPPLWVKEQFGVKQFHFPSLNLENFTAQQIPERLRLGHKMEYAFEQLINHTDSYKLLAKNVLIDRHKERLGELDFLVEDTRCGQHYHIELAYKFYIINPEISEPIHRLMGPNKRDMFFTKLVKLKTKQFPLLFAEEITETLNTLAIDTTTIKQQACFKGQLFAPYKTSLRSIRPLNTKCVIGSWIHFDVFNSVEFKSYEYYIPYKQEWVLPPTLSRNYMSHYEALLEINLRMLKENAPMLWVKKPNNTLEKLFVVWW